MGYVQIAAQHVQDPLLVFAISNDFLVRLSVPATIYPKYISVWYSCCNAKYNGTWLVVIHLEHALYLLVALYFLGEPELYFTT